MNIPIKLDSYVIGLGHKANNGKGTVAKFLVDDNPDFDIKIYCFSRLIKIELFHALMNNKHPFWEVAEKYGLKTRTYWLSQSLTDDQIVKWVDRRKDTYRKHLQIYGTEFIRAKDINYFLRDVARQIDYEKPQIAVIEDMRFWNEAVWVREIGGITINVKRPDFIKENAKGHVSESGLDKWNYDITLINEGLGQLREDTREVFKLILELNKPPQSMEMFAEEMQVNG